MSLPYPCKIAQEMNFNEEKLTNQLEVELLSQSTNAFQTPLMHPLVISSISSKEEKPVITSLRQLVEMS